MIPPISSSFPSIAAVAPAASGASTAGTGFGQILGQAIDSLQGVQSNSLSQAQQVATGQANLGDAMVASTESLLATQLAVAVRNGFVQSLDQVMSTQF
jgi:flagellar hook-basal body complex protein FliE